MAKNVTIDLNPPSSNSIADLIVSPYLAPNAQISSSAPGGNITNIELTISGKDAAGATLSLASNAPAGFSVQDVNGVWYLTPPVGPPPSDADWSKALDALKADSPDQSGSFKVTAQAFDGTRAVSGKVHDKVFVCFMAGTLISTPDGAKPVESLGIGDLVRTTDGRNEPIRWVGRQTVSRLFGDPLRILPIRVKADALEHGVPARDLLISPDHAFLLDGVLVHAGALVNGTSIVREHVTPQVFVYYHIELVDHSLIFAERAPVETFIDNVDRLAFDNWDEHEALYGEGSPIMEMAYPRAKAERQVPVAKRRALEARGAALYGARTANVA